MQSRFSTCRGMEVVEEGSEELLGFVFDILLHPDKGAVLGFFVLPTSGHMGVRRAYLSVLDILHFGARIAVRDDGVLCDPEDIIRLQSILEDPRRMLGQQMQTDTGRILGRCADVQFDTETMHVEWLFPRRFFRWKTAVPIGEVLEVRIDRIIVQDPQTPLAQETEEESTVFEAPRIPEPGV